MRKVILSALGLLIIMGSIWVAMTLIQKNKRVRPQPPKVVKTVFTDTVSNGVVPIVIQANGNLQAVRRIELFSEVQGVFRPGAKLFRTGQSYKKGQTLISIDGSEYYASVQAAKSDLYNSLAAIMPDLRLDFPEVYPKWQAYLNSFDLNKRTPDLPDRTSEKENYFLTGRGIITSYYNVRNMEQRLSKFRMTAPFDGVLTEALVTEGTLIRAGQKLGSFIDTGSYELAISVSKQYSNLLREGSKVNLKSTDNLSDYEGTVSRVNASIDPTTQTISVFVRVNHPDLKEGMFLNAQLEARQEDNAIEIDRSLITEQNEIYVVKDSVLDVVKVKPVYFGDKTAVVKEVPDGTIIVSRPLPGAYPGMLVKPYEKTDSTN